MILFTVDQGSPDFEAARAAVDVVCAGDSLTGWNNFGPADSWPYRTYPDFLQELCVPLGLRIANGGIAGEISDNGPQQVRDYLELFPNARYFVFGMGTNDLGMWPDTEATSKRIIENLSEIMGAVWNGDRNPILFNVPNVNEAMFLPAVAKELRAQRDYHNAKLKEFCDAVRGTRRFGAELRSEITELEDGTTLHCTVVPNELEWAWLDADLPLADICSRLKDEHFADELHPNVEGAKLIAEEVFKGLARMHKAWQELPK